MVRQITPSEFESYPHGRQSAAFIVSDEREWYVDGREVALGIVFRDKVDDDWGYAILGKDPNGNTVGLKANIAFSGLKMPEQTFLSRCEKSRHLAKPFGSKTLTNHVQCGDTHLPH